MQCMFVIKSSLLRLLKLVQVYDGVRRRALPPLFDALKPGTDDDRMKGALWTLNSSSFGKYAIAGKFQKFYHLNLSDIQDRTDSCQRSSLGTIWVSTSRKGAPLSCITAEVISLPFRRRFKTACRLSLRIVRTPRPCITQPH